MLKISKAGEVWGSNHQTVWGNRANHRPKAHPMSLTTPRLQSHRPQSCRNPRKVNEKNGSRAWSWKNLPDEWSNTFCYTLVSNSKNFILINASNEKQPLGSRSMLQLLQTHGMENLLFSDEKFFTVEAAYNQQNEEVLANNSSSYPENLKSVRGTQKPVSVMLYARISGNEKPLLFFVSESQSMLTTTRSRGHRSGRRYDLAARHVKSHKSTKPAEVAQWLHV